MKSREYILYGRGGANPCKTGPGPHRASGGMIEEATHFGLRVRLSTPITELLCILASSPSYLVLSPCSPLSRPRWTGDGEPEAEFVAIARVSDVAACVTKSKVANGVPALPAAPPSTSDRASARPGLITFVHYRPVHLVSVLVAMLD